MKLITIVSIILMCFHVMAIKFYVNHTVYRIVPHTNKHLQFLKNLQNQYKAVYWRNPQKVNIPVDVVISPKDKPGFLKEAAKYSLNVESMIDNVQKAFDEQTVQSYIRTKITSFDWEHYYTLDSIYNWMKDLGRQYPNILKVYSIGNSYEGREILCGQIKHNETIRSNVIIEGGIHAREWISHSVTTYLMYHVVTAPSSENPLLRSVAEKYEWFFVPVLNPDGYVYSHEGDRMWRKNRRKTGVDLNRNFDMQFGSAGSQTNPYEEDYAGVHAFSEDETKAMRDLITKHEKNLEYYLSFHSYGQYFLVPYSYSAQKLDNYDAMSHITDKAAEIIKKNNGTLYVTGTAYSTMGYTAPGSSFDWVKSTYRVPFVMAVELTDKGTYGFALPPDKILPTCLELFDGFLYILTPKSEQFEKLDSKISPRLGNGDIGVPKSNYFTVSLICFLDSIYLRFQLNVWFYD